jgi:hypothetical protein
MENGDSVDRMISISVEEPLAEFRMTQRYHILFKILEIPCYNEFQGVKDTQDEG